MLSVPEPLLTAKEVATVFRVDPRTVQRWAKNGDLEAVPTPGGRLKRFRVADVEALLNGPAHNEDGPARCITTGQALCDLTPTKE
jgi:excisionase family DNA binding protein